MQQNQNLIVSSFIWKYLERAIVYGVSFILTLVLARLLSPDDYGIIAIISIFINVANVFIHGGINSALIQKKDADEIDFNSVFYLNLIISIVFYLILFISAPFIAKFYKNDILVKIIRVLSISLILGSIQSIQVAYITKMMQYKILFVCNFISSLLSAAIGIFMALSKYGIWSLVAQQLSYNIIIIIILRFSINWKPKFIFSFSKLKVLINYGWKILVSNLINTIFLNIRSFIIGKLYEPKVLGYYNRGRQIPEIIIMNVNDTMQSVLFVAYSNEQDNKKKIKEMLKNTIRYSSFIIFPLMLGLMVIARPLVLILLTEKWLPAVPFIQICCITFMFIPIHSANLQAIKAIGYSNIILKLEVIRKIMELLILTISIRYGLYAIAIGEVISTLLSFGINLYPCKKIINYGIKEQISDTVPFLLFSIIMAIIVYLINFIKIKVILLVLLQALIGGLVYFVFLIAFKFQFIKDLFSIIKKMKGNK